MPELEKVIAGLKWCAEGEHCRSKCPYNDSSDSIIICTSELARDALELLKESVPRVMTLDEVQTDHGRVVWIECNASKVQYYGNWRGSCFWHNNVNTEWIQFEILAPTLDWLRWRADEYGKTWRCWTLQPDEKTRRKTAWQ